MEWLKTITMKGRKPVIIPVADIKKIEEHPKFPDCAVITRNMEDMEVAESVDTLYCKLTGVEYSSTTDNQGGFSYVT